MYRDWWGIPVFFLIAAGAISCIGHADEVVSLTDHHLTQSLLEQAERHYNATLFDLAIPILQQLLTMQQENTEMRAWTRLRLGQSYYFTGQFSKIPDVLGEVNTSTRSSNAIIQKHNTEGIFLLGLSYAKLGKYDLAVTSFLRYLSSEDRLLPYHNDALFELGTAYFHLNKFSEAKQQFNEISPQITKKRLFALAQLYLARIAIAENDLYTAERLIDSLYKFSSIDDIFPYSLSFLNGEIAYFKGDWDSAIHYLNRAVPEKNIQKADWAEDALYFLGWSHLNLCEQKKDQTQFIKNHLNSGEETFKILIEVFPSDRAHLALGQCYLYQAALLGKESSLQKLEKLLSDKKRFKTRQGFHHALLLRDEAAKSYGERKKLFRQLTEETNKDSPFFANAWYLKGLNEFDEGQENIIEDKHQKSSKYFENAIRAFSRAFDLLLPIDRKLAAFSLKFQVQSYYYLNTRESRLKGLSLLGKILNHYRDDLFSLYDDPDEIFFLQGLIAANLMECEEGQTFFHIAESSLVHNIESYPKGEFYDESLRLLGTLYYTNGKYKQAEEAFLKLGQKIPSSPFVGEAFFWASNSAEMSHEDPAKIKHYRKKVYEQFPNSPFAPEAYFRYYDYSEYLHGNNQAIEHLNSFDLRYPESPFILNALYLIGLNHNQERHSPDGKWKKEKDARSAIETFNSLEHAFDTFTEKGLIPEDKIAYFTTIRYRAMLESALTSLQLLEESSTPTLHLKDAEETLYRMYTEFETPHHPFAKYLASGESLTPLQEESAYHLARCYVLEGDDEAASRLLEKMIEKYDYAKITRGPYLSKVWYELGKVYSRRENYTLAIQHFKNAEDAAKGKVLRADELLDIWIELSHCHRRLGEMDEAMLILSQVINYDAVSPNRLKAMFLRALIYEEQGRHELAKRQLEAVAKKAGVWSAKAKEKLGESYVYQ